MRHVHRWRQTLLAARREDCLPKMEQPDGPRIGTDAGMLTQKWRPLWVSDVLRCTGLVRQEFSDADFFLNNRFLESIQSFTFRIDLAINRNRNNRFLK
jgi:hypothetical protein